jgi:hypothetical protein
VPDYSIVAPDSPFFKPKYLRCEYQDPRHNPCCVPPALPVTCNQCNHRIESRITTYILGTIKSALAKAWTQLGPSHHCISELHAVSVLFERPPPLVPQPVLNYILHCSSPSHCILNMEAGVFCYALNRVILTCSRSIQCK